ncbi:hypothetical protein [Kitasatospora sp. NPDC091207]|uniref:hypothetical protein n=1 Tax=Kitasatospora sp. NPDC091207 TaxID=3364083 RepID=UPI0037F3B7E1
MYLAQGAGAVLGPFVGRRFTAGSGRRRPVVAAVALGVFGLGYLALAQVSHFGLGMAAALIGHIGVGACAILAINGLQLASPDHIRGRVMATVFGSSSGLQGLSSLAVAPLAATFGMITTTVVLGTLAVTYAALWIIPITCMRETGKTIESDNPQSGPPAVRGSLGRPPPCGRRTRPVRLRRPPGGSARARPSPPPGR